MTRGTTPIAFDEDTGNPLVASSTLAFAWIERLPAAVRPFEELALQREEAGRVPAHTPEWTDFNAGDPGATWVDSFIL
jgi:hypothetical protein